MASIGLALVPLLATACAVLPAQDASHYQNVRAFNEATGRYFSVKVPYRQSVGFDPATGSGTVVERPPTREEVGQAVDEAMGGAWTRAMVEEQVHGRATTMHQAPLDPDGRTTNFGNSYHDPDSPFPAPADSADDDPLPGAPQW